MGLGLGFRADDCNYLHSYFVSFLSCLEQLLLFCLGLRFPVGSMP